MTVKQTLPRTSARLPFAGGAVLGLVGILLLGWFTPLRGVMHALLLTLSAAALVPFALVLGVIALFAAAGLATAVVADVPLAPGAVSRAEKHGGGVARAYFEQVRRQRRHPLGWGLGSGFGLGVVGVWLVLAALVVPLETRTLGALLFAQVRIDAARGAGEPPPEAADGLLHPSAWKAPAAAGDAPVVDTFARPVAYTRDPAAGGSYVLRSQGLDGSPSADDLCVRGPTALAPAPLAVRDPLQFLERLQAGQIGWPEKVSALHETRCSRLR